ncbi:MAG: hypothetical protein FWG13_02485 [Leptospirales bacterium]|nr:hypothetical protein [Leptospirales bacterium]
MKLKEPVTLIKNKENGSLQPDYLIENNDLTVYDNASIILSNHDRLELYTGTNCDIEIISCRDITIYCNSKCNILVRDQCDIEIFSDDHCKIVFCGNLASGGRIVCGDNCHIICWSNVEIEAGSNCTIDCDADCNIECRDNCSIKGNNPKYSFSVCCLDDCSIICNKWSKVDARYNCNITRIDDNGMPVKEPPNCS